MAGLSQEPPTYCLQGTARALRSLLVLSKAAAFLGAFPQVHLRGIGIALFPRQGQSYELDPTQCGRRLPTMHSAPPVPVSASTSIMTISRYWPLLGHFSWDLPSPSASQLHFNLSCEPVDPTECMVYLTSLQVLTLQGV